MEMHRTQQEEKITDGVKGCLINTHLVENAV